MSTTPVDTHCQDEILSELEKMLYIRLRDSVNHKKAIQKLNEVRIACGEKLIPPKHNPYLTLSLGDHPNEHPLDFITRRYWRPTKDLPISCDYFKKYGDDYLLGYLDGLESRDFESSSVASESYCRGFVDGRKQMFRESHLKGTYYKNGKYRYSGNEA